MKIFMTGVSSFTGCHIARALILAGHEVWGVLTRNQKFYQQKGTLAQRRLEYSLVRNFVEESPFGSLGFFKALERIRPDYFLNHGAPIQGYRSPDFPFLESTQKSLENVAQVLEIFQQVGGKGVLHSGTVFEPSPQQAAASPYGLSKLFVSETLRFYCSEKGLTFKKIFIPNPIGIFENEDRLIPLFISKWKKREKVQLTQPEQINDNLPAGWLAQFYVEELNRPETPSFRSPSGFVCSNQELCLELKKYFEKIFKIPADLEFRSGFPKAPRLGKEPSSFLEDQQAREDFWVSLLDFYRER